MNEPKPKLLLVEDEDHLAAGLKLNFELEGFEVDIAAPTKKKLQFVVHDFVDGYDTYTEKPGHCWDADIAFADVNPDDYVAAVIPGGRAPEYIRNNEDAKRIVRAFFDRQSP